MSDSDILTNFKTALMTKFNALVAGSNNAFYNSIQGRLFDGRVPIGIPYPHSRFFVVTHTPDRTFTEDHRDLIVQFSHYSIDTENAAEVELINAYCNDLFDECAAFSITGATLIWMRMTNSPGAQQEDFTTASGTEGGWHAPTDFDVRISMN